MGYPKFIITILLLVITGCINTGSSLTTQKNNKDITSFFSLLKKGYLKSGKKGKFLLRYPKNTLICIYNDEPNSVSKQTISKFFLLLKKELDFGEHIYVNKLESCPQRTHIYLQLRDELNYYKSLGSEFTKVFKRHNIDTKINTLVGRMGFGGFRIRRDKTIGFASVFQMTNHINKKEIKRQVNELIIEELYQTIAMGRDVDVEEMPMSILNEVNFTYGGALDHRDDIDVDTFRSKRKKNPYGLCGYDLWFLLTVYKFENRIIPFEVFTTVFNENFSKIKAQALIIENKPEYKGLFDPRCSGENTGINTKIGIEPPQY